MLRNLGICVNMPAEFKCYSHCSRVLWTTNQNYAIPFYSQIPNVQPWLRHGTRHTRLSCWLTNKGNIFVTSQTSAEIETLRLAFQPNKKNICWFISSDWSLDLADADEIKCLITTVTACQSCHIQGIWLDCCSILRDDKKDHGGMVNLQQQRFIWSLLLIKNERS